MDASNPCHPWSLGSGAPPAIPDRGRLCRNDEENLNSTALDGDRGQGCEHGDHMRLNQFAFVFERGAANVSPILAGGGFVQYRQFGLLVSCRHYRFQG